MTNQQKIAEDARKARELGMTYGAYKAMGSDKPIVRSAKKVIQTRKCACCGKEFPVKSNRYHIYCSIECNNEEANRRKREHRKVSPTRPCAYCGKPFPNHNGGQRYCSITCKTLMAIARKEKRSPGRPSEVSASNNT